MNGLGKYLIAVWTSNVLVAANFGIGSSRTRRWVTISGNELRMYLQLNDKRALVTGSTSGIGAEIARMLGAEGVKIVVHGRDRDRAETVANEIERMGGIADIALGDLTTRQGIEGVIETAALAFDGIDILINNAGGSNAPVSTSWLETPGEEWTENYQQNVLPAVYLSQAFVPGMRRRGWGRIIQISSRNAVSAYSQFGPYCAAKAALNNLTLSLSKALAGSGVTANGIMPGLIYTPFTQHWFESMAKQLGSNDPEVGQSFAIKDLLGQSVGRLGQPKDIAAAVCFIASPLSDFMTGTTFRIDGGATSTV